MPGCGKSIVGRLLAHRLSSQFIDTDEMIEERTGMTIPEIFTEYGERNFRDFEKEVILGLGDSSNTVISCGGGAVLDSENFSFLSGLGMVVYLKAKPETLLKRVEEEEKDRPLLKEEFSGSNDLLQVLKDLQKNRETIYQKAKYSIETDHRHYEEVVDSIIGILKS